MLRKVKSSGDLAFDYIYENLSFADYRSLKVKTEELSVLAFHYEA